jgi:hypothetical protein
LPWKIRVFEKKKIKYRNEREGGERGNKKYPLSFLDGIFMLKN